ncbi:DNA polymerase zeta [Boothiomyces sp. JEL0838]|nr:DNA polymerase zeta [Boothiomyces sp. JEL0838]
MKFRITNLDFFLDKPGELDHQHSQFGPTTQVPIIRIFGASEYGQKALIMVHKIYQYFYIKYSGTLEDADEYIRVLGNSINHAMGQLKSNGEKRTHLSKDLFIHSIKLVQGVDFYGFHSTYSLFLKISVINPHNVNKIVELFQNGVILNQRFNVFEHHIPYLFQFLLDYNLYGMDFIEFDRYVSKRIKEVPRKYPIDANVQLFNCENIMADSRKPISYCEMEIDIMNIWITNKDKMKERKFQPLKNELCEELLIPSLNHLWKDEEYRRQMHDLPPLQSNSSAYTRNDYVPWKNEYKFQEQIQEILLSKRAELIYSPHLNNKDRDENGIYRKVPTIFQSLHSTDVEKMIGDDDIDINKEKLSQLTCEILQEMYSSSEDEYMDEEYDELMNGIKSQVGSKNDLEDHSFLKPEECQLESEDIHVQGEEIVLPNNKIKQTLVVSPKTQLQTPQKVIQTLTDESPLFIDIPITIPNSVNALHKNSSIEDVIVPTSPVIIASNPSSQKSISPQTNMISRSSTETILPASPVVEASPNKSVRNSLFHPKAQRANSVSLSSLQLPKSPELSPVQSRKRKFGINETANKYPRLQVDETFAYELVIPQLDGAFELKKKKKHRKKEKSKSNFLNYKLFPIGNELDILNWPLECSKSICRLWSPAPNVDISKFAFFMDPPRPFSPSCPGIIRNNDWGGEMQQITPSVKAIKLNFDDEQNLEEIPEAQDVVPELDNVRMHKNSIGDFELQNETENERWNSCVVYGDTDSLFVQMPNIPKELAFDFGYEIVNSVTRANPYPVKLKFEKVYFPSILLAKKRYVGFSFENKSDIEPTFDAKGIETVRRDGCPLVAKMVENCLKMLFRSKDLSMVKEYLIQQWQKILNGHVSIQDYIIAKEVKLGSYSKRGTLPAGAQISTKKIEQDPNAEPQYKERIPYVVVHKGPKHRLIDAVVSPEQLLNDQSLRIHGTYYITKQLMGPLSRIFNIVGADVERWYNEMPKAHKAITYVPTDSTGKKTIDHFYLSNHCLLCNTLAEDRICSGCMKNRPNAILQLENKVYLAEQRFKNIQSICRDCAGHNSLLDPEIACLSLDCPIYYDRVESIINVKNATAITTLLDTIDDNASLDW